MLTHGSLFAGIGGFDLGFSRVGIETIWQVELDDYCRRVLARHFPGAKRFADVRECSNECLSTPDIISGGFPCQDISLANKQRNGLAGERSSLWFEYFRLICELRPRFVVVENVAAILIPVRDDAGRITEPAPISRVLGDLAAIGYHAEWDCFPAAAFGAFHFRDRVFIVASQSSNPNCLRPQGQWTLEAGAWPEQQFARLLQDQIRISVPTGKSGGVVDGVLDRAHRLKALGNAIVPQIAEWIGRRIVAATQENS
jgi:DNA (cytosine-5)-methyltransferase 1